MRKAAFILYIGSMIFGVLFFGAIHTWVYTLVFLGVMAASLLMLKGEVVKPDTLVPSSSPSAGRSAEEAPARRERPLHRPRKVTGPGLEAPEGDRACISAGCGPT